MHAKDGQDVSMTQLIPFNFDVPGLVLCCPTADLAAVPVKGVDMKSVALYPFTGANVPQPGDEFWDQMMDVGTEVQMPGYPGGVIDKHNKVPVFRFGRLAQDPTMDWFGDQSGVVNMNVYPTDSGAPIVWMGQAQQSHLIKSDKPDRHQIRIVVRDEVKLLGIHTGGFSTSRKGDVALGVFAKAQVLAGDNIKSWVPMNTRESEMFAPLHVSKSNHALHASGIHPPVDYVQPAEPMPLDVEVAKTLGNKEFNLVETLSGRTWNCTFEAGVLIRISNSRATFSRIAPWKFGGAEEAKLPTFAKFHSEESADCIFLSHCFAPDKRSDKIVLSGYQCFEMAPKDEVPFAPDSISWILK